MNCLEFKRLALSDPHSREPSFVTHSKDCPDCLKYIGGVRQMDTDLSDSLDVSMPESLKARLELNQLLQEETGSAQPSHVRRFAIAASMAFALFVSGFMANNYFGPVNSIGQDYEALLAGVVEHMHEEPITPVWDPQRANQSANTHLTNYDGNMRLKYLANLQFSRLCPMGQYRGLHASLETADGQVTFAYIKGENVEDVLDAAYEGYIAKVKPVRGGTLVILSRTQKALQVADKQLEEAIYWET